MKTIAGELVETLECHARLFKEMVEMLKQINTDQKEVLRIVRRLETPREVSN